MKPSNTSELLAASMQAILQSPEYKKIFASNFSLEEQEVDTNIEDDKEEEQDCSYGDDGFCEYNDHNHLVTAFDVAIDSLLTASSALDDVNMGSSSSLALKLAGLVAEAKKAKKEDIKKKMEELRKGKDKCEDKKEDKSKDKKSDKYKKEIKTKLKK